MDDLLALAAPAAAPAAPAAPVAPMGEIVRRAHRRTHGNGPGRSKLDMTIESKKLQIANIDSKLEAKKEFAEHSEFQRDALSQTDLDFTFNVFANARCSIILR